MMKKFLLLVSIILLSGCNNSSYDRIRNYIDRLDIVDTHEHIQLPGDSADFTIFNTVSYFPGDMVSSGAQFPENSGNEKPDLDSLWIRFGEYYNYSRATSYHEQFMNSLRILYGYDKPFLAKEDVKAIYDKMIINKFRNYPSWFDHVYHTGRFKTMILDQYWDHFNTDIDTSYFRLVCNINTLVLLAGEAAENKKITSEKGLLQLMKATELPAADLDNYLRIVDSVLQIFKDRGAVCLKNTLAYSRTLDFEDVPYAEASSVFDRKVPLNPSEKKKIEDFVFHHIVQQSVRLDLPIQIHTGYLAGNNSQLDNGHPMKLLNILLKYPEARFSLFHGGFPWTGDFAAIGKNFTNVYLDLVWLPQISKTEAIRSLHEILDAVPYNKIMWGGDVSWIDDTVGSLELAKEVVATVLAERVDKGWMTEEMTKEIAKRIFTDNAVEFFRLKM
jgi:hypothetical protein